MGDLDKLLRKRQRSTGDKQLSQIRRVLLTEGLNEQECQTQRALLWKVLLRLSTSSLDSRAYMDLISREPSPVIEKIRNDTFRTLATDPNFKERVGEDRLIRLLDAFVWRGLGW
jgi:cell cycle arrest protein BUB2